METNQPPYTDPCECGLVRYTPLCNLRVTLFLCNGIRFTCIVREFIPYLFRSSSKFYPLSSASVIGLYISYVTPIYFRITSGNHKFEPGPFHLGRWSRFIGATAVVWVAFMAVMLLFPWTQTPSPQTMSKSDLLSDFVALHLDNTTTDYGVVIILSMFLFASISWIFSARHWFTGPIPNIDRTESESENENEPK